MRRRQAAPIATLAAVARVWRQRAAPGAQGLAARARARRWTAVWAGAALLTVAGGAAASMGQSAARRSARHSRHSRPAEVLAARARPAAAHGPTRQQPTAHPSAAAPAAGQQQTSQQTAAALQTLAAAARCGGHPPAEHLIAGRRWLSGVILTEYYPAPERWFSGRLVPTPGMTGRHHVDWLYSAHGLSMEGDGLDRAGRLAHIQSLGSVGWVNAAGTPTVPPHCGIRWSHGPPEWRAGGWRNRDGQVTYPLQTGDWSRGRGHWVGAYGGATFASGPSLPVRFYHSVAVDPRLIPEGSRIFIPTYRPINGGWFVAQDTGGAIIGRHIDVYVPPPAQQFASGRLSLGARVYVIPPGH
jgi:3D (Asp-Asp-Asp) domain-containing protein